MANARKPSARRRGTPAGATAAVDAAAKPPRHPAFDRDDQFQKRRQALVQIAIHFFNRRGFHATSMEAIATEVGLTKGTLYHYYDSKTDLANECVLESVADGLRMAQKAYGYFRALGSATSRSTQALPRGGCAGAEIS